MTLHSANLDFSWHMHGLTCLYLYSLVTCNDYTLYMLWAQWKQIKRIKMVKPSVSNGSTAAGLLQLFEHTLDPEDHLLPDLPCSNAKEDDCNLVPIWHCQVYIYINIYIYTHSSGSYTIYPRLKQSPYPVVYIFYMRNKYIYIYI